MSAESALNAGILVWEEVVLTVTAEIALTAVSLAWEVVVIAEPALAAGKVWMWPATAGLIPSAGRVYPVTAGSAPTAGTQVWVSPVMAESALAAEELDAVGLIGK